MSDKKKHEINEPVSETQPEVAELSEGGKQPDIQVEALQSQLAEVEAKAAEFKDGWMRTQAEFQNYKNRLQRENELLYASMKGDIVRKVLPVLDDLERALQNRPADDAWANGIELIARKLQAVLESENVKRIDAAGAEFDPNFHEAISHEPNDDVPSGHVIEIVQNGYMLGERVIRPAMVRVAQ